jgi:hypothetical protein
MKIGYVKTQEEADSMTRMSTMMGIPHVWKVGDEYREHVRE